MIQINAGRDINNAPNGSIHTENSELKQEKSLVRKFFDFISAHLIELSILILAGIIVAFVVFKMHWN